MGDRAGTSPEPSGDSRPSTRSCSIPHFADTAFANRHYRGHRVTTPRTTPTNPILKYQYAVLKSETRVAVAALGLDPGGLTQSGQAQSFAPTACAALSAWDASSQPAWLSAKVFSERIQPLLARVSSSAIACRIGVSRWYAGCVRKGYRPHLRHWKALASLVNAVAK
jgi:hypothetical protein